ncbi:hypothetical protein [Nitrosopumilus sp.]|uniref:hypothetical protein n=1 Tax=Nitrosopumilus sp. TaxID=2024843 RepID=UPI00292F3CC3|nr:hypothetical protein [Nitrosopumilus sp.]
MTNISCRTCGTELETNQECDTCHEPIEFVCHSCGKTTEKRIHFDCTYGRRKIISVSV